ncbi:hypothetical protein F4861DRAFT_509820 [Xylaria intraflava]|nr:hypothetical protein F4861DRAFT_509820 [Xylaria intraflava]
MASEVQLPIYFVHLTEYLPTLLLLKVTGRAVNLVDTLGYQYAQFGGIVIFFFFLSFFLRPVVLAHCRHSYRPGGK